MSSDLLPETVNTSSFLSPSQSTSSSSRKRDIGDDNLSINQNFLNAFNGMASASAGAPVMNVQHCFSFDSAPPKKRMKMIHDQAQLLQITSTPENTQNAGPFVDFAILNRQNVSGLQSIGPVNSAVNGQLLSVPFTQHQQAFSNIGNFSFGNQPPLPTITGMPGRDAIDGAGLLQNLLFQNHQQQQLNDSNATNMLNAAVVSNLLNSNPALAVSMLLGGLNGVTNNNSNLTQQAPFFDFAAQQNSLVPVSNNSLNNLGCGMTKSEPAPPLSTTDTTNLLNLLNVPDISALLSAILPVSTSVAFGSNVDEQQVAPPELLSSHNIATKAADIPISVDVKSNLDRIDIHKIPTASPSSGGTAAVAVNSNKRRPSKRKSTKTIITQSSPASDNTIPASVVTDKCAADVLSANHPQARQQQRPFKMYPKDALNLPIAGDVASQLNNSYTASQPLTLLPSPHRHSSGSTTKNGSVEVSSSATGAVPADKLRETKTTSGNVTSTTATSSAAIGSAQTPLLNYSAGLDASDVQQLLSSSSALSSALNDEAVVRKALQQFNKWKQERNAKGGRRASNHPSRTPAKQSEFTGTSAIDSTSSQSPSSTTNPLTSAVASNSPTSPSTSSSTSGVAQQQRRSTHTSGNNNAQLPQYDGNQHSSQHADDNTSTSGGTTVDGENDKDEDPESVDGTKHGGRRARDASYWERRRKNNDAAKRSRDSRRRKEDEIALRCAFLECENEKLKNELVELKRETYDLKCLLYNA